MSTEAPSDLRTLPDSLGAPRHIATAAAHEYRRAHFCRRHPILSFVVMPIVALPLLWALSIVGFVALVGTMRYFTGDEFAWAGPALPLVVCAIVLAPITLAAWFFCRLSRKSQVGWKWTLAACLLLAVLSGPAMVDVAIRGSHTRGMLHGTKYRDDVPMEAGKTGFLSFGFGLQKYPSLVQIAQFALPLSIGAWALCRQANQRRNACLG